METAFIFKFEDSNIIVVKEENKFDINAGGGKDFFAYFFYTFYDEDFNEIRKHHASKLVYREVFTYVKDIELQRRISKIDIMLKS